MQLGWTKMSELSKRNAEIYEKWRLGENTVVLANEYQLSRQRIYQICQETKKEKTRGKSFIYSLDTHTRNALLRAGFPKNGTRDLLYDMIESGEWENTFRTIGAKTLETISRIIGEKVKFELAYKRTEKIGRHEYTETIKRLVFDRNGNEGVDNNE